MKCHKEKIENPDKLSLPTRERGLKSGTVGPYAGAWIEIGVTLLEYAAKTVAPYAGAWIEITPIARVIKANVVAPYAGAWIEIM